MEALISNLRCLTTKAVKGMFTIKFKRELIRCCYCLRGALKRRRMDQDSNGIKRSLLFPLKRNSESSTSSRNERHCRPQPPPGEVATTPNGQGCRYSFVSPLAEVKTSSSRASLSSVGREDRLNREERASFYQTDRVSLSPSIATFERSSTGNVCVREDRANLNNFIRIA